MTRILRAGGLPRAALLLQRHRRVQGEPPPSRPPSPTPAARRVSFPPPLPTYPHTSRPHLLLRTLLAPIASRWCQPTVYCPCQHTHSSSSRSACGLLASVCTRCIVRVTAVSPHCQQQTISCPPPVSRSTRACLPCRTGAAAASPFFNGRSRLESTVIDFRRL